jgi:hypothetical protein
MVTDCRIPSLPLRHLDCISGGGFFPPWHAARRRLVDRIPAALIAPPPMPKAGIRCGNSQFPMPKIQLQELALPNVRKRRAALAALSAYHFPGFCRHRSVRLDRLLERRSRSAGEGQFVWCWQLPLHPACEQGKAPFSAWHIDRNDGGQLPIRVSTRTASGLKSMRGGGRHDFRGVNCIHIMAARRRFPHPAWNDSPCPGAGSVILNVATSDDKSSRQSNCRHCA